MKPTLSNANGTKLCSLLEHVFSCLTTLLETTLRAVCSSVKVTALNPTSGKARIKSTVNDLDIILKRRYFFGL
jgi:hypothetical protein